MTASLIMNKTEMAQAMVAGGHVERLEDAEALLDDLASILWHALEHEHVVEWPKVGTFGVAPADRRRRAVTFQPASELEVAVNRHHLEI
jgi:nucleoid DNA-binding protein